MLSKSEIVAAIAQVDKEYKKHLKNSESELNKISLKLAGIDSELEFAKIVNDEEQIIEISGRFKKLEDKKKEIIASDLLYKQKIEQLKTFMTSYAKNRIENAHESEIDLDRTGILNSLEVNCAAKIEEITKYREQYDKLEAAKKVDLATAEYLELEREIEKIKKKYIVGTATDEDLAQAKKMSDQRKEIRATAEKRAKEQETSINYQQQTIQGKIEEIQVELKTVEEKRNRLAETSIEDYRKKIIEKLIEAINRKEDLNNPRVMYQRKTYLRLASDKDLLYLIESLLRKLAKLNNFEHFVVNVNSNYSSYVKDSAQKEGFSVDLSDEAKRDELKARLLEDMTGFNKIEELRRIDIHRIPTLTWAKENGWFTIPLNLNFYNENKLLGASFNPSAVLRADSLNLAEKQRQLIIDEETKNEIEELKKEIEKNLWRELGTFFAEQISMVYLNGRRIWPAKVQNSIVLQREIDTVLDKNAIYKKEAEDLLLEIDTFIANSEMEKEEKAKIVREIASQLGIPVDICMELIDKKELTEETISKENFVIQNQMRNFDEDEFKPEDFKIEEKVPEIVKEEDYFDDLDEVLPGEPIDETIENANIYEFDNGLTLTPSNDGLGRVA
ncbi:MAG: hypothetical protein HFJ02_04515 [Bacilli bacterium]|nr:hypothetical protein [Bacilli bacterium]